MASSSGSSAYVSRSTSRRSASTCRRRFVPTLVRGRFIERLPTSCSRTRPALRERLDTEFLHDFRVALRRTRSLLGQIRDVFPAACRRTLLIRVLVDWPAHRPAARSRRAPPGAQGPDREILTPAIFGR